MRSHHARRCFHKRIDVGRPFCLGTSFPAYWGVPAGCTESCFDAGSGARLGLQCVRPPTGNLDDGRTEGKYDALPSGPMAVWSIR
jgi:hypothetical protein